MSQPGFVPVEGHVLIAQVETLAREIWLEYYPPLIGEAQVEYMLGRFQSAQAVAVQIAEGHRYYLVRDGQNAPVGYFSVRPGADGLFLGKIYVRAPERGKGYGRESLRFIEGSAKEKGCSRVWLTVYKGNKDSIGFYERNGYRRVGEVVQDIGQGFVMDDYRMEKPLV